MPSELHTFESGAVRDKKDGKGRFDLVPVAAIRAIAHVLEYGAKRYGDRNWEKGIPAKSFIDSGLRHLTQHMEDPDSLDDDSTLPHLYHALCNFAMLVHVEDADFNRRLMDAAQSLDGDEVEALCAEQDETPKTVTKWWARSDFVTSMGPYDTQEEACRSLKRHGGGIVDGAFVWPETEEVS